LATQTARASAASPLGSAPTVMVATTLLLTGSIRDTVPLSALATHTARRSAATPRG